MCHIIWSILRCNICSWEYVPQGLPSRMSSTRSPLVTASESSDEINKMAIARLRQFTMSGYNVFAGDEVQCPA